MRKKSTQWQTILVAALIAAVIYLWDRFAPPETPPSPSTTVSETATTGSADKYGSKYVPKYVLCGRGRWRDCVVDGDTIRDGTVKIRILDLDAPEIFSPQCDAEKALGEKAKLRLLDLLNQGPVQIVESGGRSTDKHGRALRLILRNGQSLGDHLIREGLARPWGHGKQSWCP